jgi:hypothetical protein
MSGNLASIFRISAFAVSAGLMLYGGSEMIKNFPAGETPAVARQEACLATPGRDCSDEIAAASQAIVDRGLSAFGGEALAGAGLVGAVLLAGGSRRKFKTALPAV